MLKAKLAEWSQTSRHRIKEQLKSMGGLLNWSEEVGNEACFDVVLYIGSKTTSRCY